MLQQLEHRTAAAALLVGLIWGSTNPLIRRGTLAVGAARAQQQADTDKGSWQRWVTPGVIVPWLANQLGSVLFVVLLGQADISMAVPVANAVSLAANAVVSGWRHPQGSAALSIQQPALTWYALCCFSILCSRLSMVGWYYVSKRRLQMRLC